MLGEGPARGIDREIEDGGVQFGQRAATRVEAPWRLGEQPGHQR